MVFPQIILLSFISNYTTLNTQHFNSPQTTSHTPHCELVTFCTFLPAVPSEWHSLLSYFSYQNSFHSSKSQFQGHLLSDVFLQSSSPHQFFLTFPQHTIFLVVFVSMCFSTIRLRIWGHSSYGKGHGYLKQKIRTDIQDGINCHFNTVLYKK